MDPEKMTQQCICSSLALSVSTPVCTAAQTHRKAGKNGSRAMSSQGRACCVAGGAKAIQAWQARTCRDAVWRNHNLQRSHLGFMASASGRKAFCMAHGHLVQLLLVQNAAHSLLKIPGSSILISVDLHGCRHYRLTIDHSQANSEPDCTRESASSLVQMLQVLCCSRHHQKAFMPSLHIRLYFQYYVHVDIDI